MKIIITSLLNYLNFRSDIKRKLDFNVGGVGEGDFYPWGGCILMIHPIPGGQNRASGRVDHLQDPRFFAYLAWSPLTPGFWGGWGGGVHPGRSVCGGSESRYVLM